MNLLGLSPIHPATPRQTVGHTFDVAPMLDLSVILGQVQPSRFRFIEVEPGFEHFSLSANQLDEHSNETLTLGFPFNDFVAG